MLGFFASDDECGDQFLGQGLEGWVGVIGLQKGHGESVRSGQLAPGCLIVGHQGLFEMDLLVDDERLCGCASRKLSFLLRRLLHRRDLAVQVQMQVQAWRDTLLFGDHNS